MPATAGKLPLAVLPLVLTYLAIAMNMTMASIAVPTISVELQASAAELAWIVSITPMVSAAFLPFAGAWSDRWGHKRLLTAGVVVFLIAAVFSGLASSPEVLIVMRGLTGFGSALAMPAALTITFSLTSGNSQRTAVGIMGAAQAIGALLGPLVGGAVLVVAGWQAAFWSITPLLALALILNALVLPADQPHARQMVDSLGAALTAVLGASLLYAAASASAMRWIPTGVALFTAVVAVLVLRRWEQRAPAPLFDAAVVSKASFLVPTVAVVLVQFALGGLLFLNTQYVQLVLGFSALGAGLLLMPALLAWTAASAAAGVTARRWGLRTVTVVALVIGALGLLLVSSGGVSPVYPVFLVGLALLGAMGVVPALMTHSAVSNYTPERRSTGSSINSMAVRYGLALGVAVYGLVASWVYRRQLAPATSSLPEGSREVATESLGGALAVSKTVSDPGLAEAARQSFASGFTVALIVAALIALALAMFLWRYLPSEVPERSSEVTQ